MKNEEPKKYIITLMRNGDVIPQYGLYFSNKESAQHTADYLNSILPKNARVNETYVVEKMSAELDF